MMLSGVNSAGVVRTAAWDDNPAVPGRSAIAVVAVLLVSIVGGCTNEASNAPGHSGQPARPTTSSRPAAVALGAAGCRPASPVTAGMDGIPQVEGTGHGASLWGLLMFPHLLPARVGDQEKIVWRMTGSGVPRMTAIGPDGRARRLAWGPAFHTSSN